MTEKCFRRVELGGNMPSEFVVQRTIKSADMLGFT